MTKKLITLSQHKNICQKLNSIKSKRQWVHIRRMNYALEFESAIKVVDVFIGLLNEFDIFSDHFPHQFDVNKLDRAMK